MTQDEIIEMARQAGFKMENSAAIQAAKAFAKLVAEKALAQEKALEALHNENERLGLYKDAYAEQEPPQRTWVGLTDDDIADCAEKMEASDPTDSFWREFFRGIEAKLKEKNT